MGNQLSGLLGYSASAPLGLPESYGISCFLVGGLIFLFAAYFLQEAPDPDAWSE